MKRKKLEEKACHLGVIGWSSRGGNVEIKRWDNVDSKRERRPLWNTDRAQAPGSATHGADLAARYPEAVLSIALPMPYPVDQSPASTTR